LRMIATRFRLGTQQDSHEYLMFILDSLQKK